MNSEDKEAQASSENLKNAEYLLNHLARNNSGYQIHSYSDIVELLIRYCNINFIGHINLVEIFCSYSEKNYRCSVQYGDMILGEKITVSYDTCLNAIALIMERGWEPKIKINCTEVGKLEDEIKELKGRLEKYRRIVELMACAEF